MADSCSKLHSSAPVELTSAGHVGEAVLVQYLQQPLKHDLSVLLFFAECDQKEQVTAGFAIVLTSLKV